MAKMNQEVEKATLKLTGNLISQCHKNTPDPQIALSALKAAQEIILSGLVAGVGVFVEDAPTKSSESLLTRQPSVE